MWTVEPLALTMEERTELERRVRAQTTPHRDRQRAQVVLLAADGVTGRKIAKDVGLSPQAVCKWRIRFRDLGLSGLEDAERSGRPLVYGPTDRLVLMAKVTSELPEFTSQWSHSELADGDGQLPASRSPRPRSGGSSRKDDVRPHKVDGLADATGHPRVLGACRGRLRSLSLAAGECRRALHRREDRRSRPKSRKHPTTTGASGTTGTTRVRVPPPRHRIAPRGARRRDRQGHRHRHRPRTTR